MAGVDPMKSKFGYNPQSDTYDELREITKNLEQTIAKGGYKIVGTKDVASGMMKYSLEKVH